MIKPKLSMLCHLGVGYNLLRECIAIYMGVLSGFFVLTRLFKGGI